LTACRQTLSESVGYVAQRSLFTNWTRVMQRYSEAGRRIYQPSVSITNIDWTKISTSQVAKDSSAQETQVQ
jgi:hypothetical protein